MKRKFDVIKRGAETIARRQPDGVITVTARVHKSTILKAIKTIGAEQLRNNGWDISELKKAVGL